MYEKENGKRGTREEKKEKGDEEGIRAVARSSAVPLRGNVRRL